MKKLLALVLTMLLLAAAPINALAKSKTSSSSSDEVIFSKENTLVINSVVEDESVAKLIAQAKSMDAALPSGDAINLLLNTPGGSIQSGLELIEVLSSLNRPVNTVIIFAASMGFQIVQNLGKRYVLKNGVLMSHKARGMFNGEFPGQVDSRYGLWINRINELDEQTVKRTSGKQTLKSYRAAYENELWLTGSDAVKGGYADEIVTAKCDKTLGGTRSEVLYFFGLKIDVIFDECPLNTYPIDVKINVPTTEGLLTLERFYELGGAFGPGCKAGQDDYVYYNWGTNSSSQQNVSAKSKRPCALDETLTMEKVQEAKIKAKEKYNNIREKVVKGY